jgi:hypothetical protein
MSVATIIERILGKQRQRQEARQADFSGIVQAIAEGEEPDVERIDAVLHEAGKSLDELREAVERLQHRRELKARLDRLPALASKRSQVERQIAEAGQALEQAEDRHEATVSPLRMHLEDIKEQIWAGEQARHELWNTCTDPQLNERLNAVVAETADFQRTAAALRAGIERHHSVARADRDRADRLVFDSRSADLRKQGDEHDAEAGRLQARLKAAEKEIAALQKREAAIRDEMLVP